jgi:hypothetical protein
MTAEERAVALSRQAVCLSCGWTRPDPSEDCPVCEAEASAPLGDLISDALVALIGPKKPSSISALIDGEKRRPW